MDTMLEATFSAELKKTLVKEKCDNLLDNDRFMRRALKKPSKKVSENPCPKLFAAGSGDTSPAFARGIFSQGGLPP